MHTHGGGDQDFLSFPCSPEREGRRVRLGERGRDRESGGEKRWGGGGGGGGGERDFRDRKRKSLRVSDSSRERNNQNLIFFHFLIHLFLVT